MVNPSLTRKSKQTVLYDEQIQVIVEVTGSRRDPNLQQELGVEFIHVCDFIIGVVVLQFPAMKMTIYVAGNLRIDCPKQEQQEGRSSLLERACARGLG